MRTLGSLEMTLMKNSAMQDLSVAVAVIDVFPIATPVTVPFSSTVATDGFAEDHVTFAAESSTA